MTTEQIREMLQSPAYEFLRSNEHLKGKIIFLTLGGSYSYGTNVETSDVDIRGCALNSRSDLLGLSNFEQVVHTETDTTVYSFNKLVSLLLNCNPNTIEMLGCRPEQYMVCTDIGREMIESRKLFLSKRAVNSFGGYANQQLRRLENALARDKLPQAWKSTVADGIGREAPCISKDGGTRWMTLLMIAGKRNSWLSRLATASVAVKVGSVFFHQTT